MFFFIPCAVALRSLVRLIAPSHQTHSENPKRSCFDPHKQAQVENYHNSPLRTKERI